MAEAWKEAGELVATIARRRPDLRSKLRVSLLNDILIALGARSIGAMVVTRNRDDFEDIRRFKPFRLDLV